MLLKKYVLWYNQFKTMNSNDYKIRLETPADYRKVEELTREAF